MDKTIEQMTEDNIVLAQKALDKLTKLERKFQFLYGVMYILVAIVFIVLVYISIR